MSLAFSGPVIKGCSPVFSVSVTLKVKETDGSNREGWSPKSSLCVGGMFFVLPDDLLFLVSLVSDRFPCQKQL